MKRDVKRKTRLILASTFFLIAIAAASFGVYRIGKNIGMDAGIAAGKAVGSFKGVTNGVAKGSSDGKEKGLSADDTQVVIQEMKASGKFQVLRADLKLDNFQELGKNKDKDYVALYKEDGYAIYTVDLQEAVVTVNGNGSGIAITVPEPEVQLFWDAESIEEVAYYQKQSFTGSAEDGLKAFKNSFMKTDEETWEKLGNYEALMEQAKESAKKQIEALAVSVRSTPGTVEIQFRGE